MDKNYIIEEITNKLNDVDVEFTEINKNGIMKKAIRVQKKGLSIAPVFYYDSTDSDDKIVDLVVNGFATHGNPGIDVNDLAHNIFDWNWAKERIYPRLYNTSRINDDSIINYELAGDISIGFSIFLDNSSDDGVMSTKAMWNMLDKWGASKDELIDAAKANLNKKLIVDSMMNVLFNHSLNGGERRIDMSDIMTVCTSTNGVHGAAAILLLADLVSNGEIDDADYYILPSSIHEAILLREYNENLGSMVKEVNATQVLPEDFLSDNVFKYDKATKSIIMM